MEIMIVMENLVKMKEIPEVPVYLDGMIWEATAIHTAYPEYLNNKLRTQIFQQGDNPLLSEIFKRVDSGEMREKILTEKDPCVVLATSGMMNGGPVMEYFKHWSGESKIRWCSLDIRQRAPSDGGFSEAQRKSL
jgi:predicted metal-dependent RNase